LSTAENLTPMRMLSALGQSIWIDFLSRESNRNGHLQGLIDDDSVVGATSNPSIFQKAMASGTAYEEQLRELDPQLAIKDVFWTLAEQDIRDACDLFRPIFDGGGGRDGYVSLEVDPRLAYDTLATFREAMHLHEIVQRPNLMVKIPATKPGLGAIEDVIAKGKSINVTLIFSLRRYEDVAESYVRGLERLVAEGGELLRLADRHGGRQTARRARRSRRAQGQARRRQRAARIPALQGDLRRTALGVPRVQGRYAAARAVGVDVGQEPRLP